MGDFERLRQDSFSFSRSFNAAISACIELITLSCSLVFFFNLNHITHYMNICSCSFSYSICFFLNYFSLKLYLHITFSQCCWSSLSASCFTQSAMILFVRSVLNTCVALSVKLKKSHFQCGACMWCFCSCAGSTCFCSSDWTDLNLPVPGKRMWLYPDWLTRLWDWRMRPTLHVRWPC